jgi:hypothetical protein
MRKNTGWIDRLHEPVYTGDIIICIEGTDEGKAYLVAEDKEGFYLGLISEINNTMHNTKYRLTTSRHIIIWRGIKE